MAIISGNYVPSEIPNTTKLEKIDSVTLEVRAYAIKAVNGYVIHDNAGDWTYTDPVTGDEIKMLAFYSGNCTCSASYDFNTTTTVDGYTAYGTREFFAKPASEVPENQIFGVTNKPESM